MDDPLLLTALCALDGVLPMIPSEVAVLAAGVLSENVMLLVLAVALGVFVGDHLAYGLSRRFVGARFLKRVAGRLDHRAGPLIVASRFLPGGRVTMNLACGTARVPLRRFTPASAIAALAWSAYAVGLGSAGGAAFAGNPVLAVAAALGLSLVLGGTAELVRRRISRPARSGVPAVR